MSPVNSPAAAAKDALLRFADCSPARRALAEEAMGGLLIAEVLSGMRWDNDPSRTIPDA